MSVDPEGSEHWTTSAPASIRAWVDLLGAHHHSENEVLGVDEVSGEGEGSGVSGDDGVVLSVGLGQKLDRLDGDGGPAALDELLGGHEVGGVVVLAGHGVEFEGVGLDHGCGVLLLDLDGGAEPLGLSGQAERSPAALEAEHVGLSGTEFGHELSVLVSLGPSGSDLLHLSEGGGLGEDGDCGPVQGFLFHSSEYSVSRSHCHFDYLLGARITLHHI